MSEVSNLLVSDPVNLRFHGLIHTQLLALPPSWKYRLPEKRLFAIFLASSLSVSHVWKKMYGTLCSTCVEGQSKETCQKEKLSRKCFWDLIQHISGSTKKREVCDRFKKEMLCDKLNGQHVSKKKKNKEIIRSDWIKSSQTYCHHKQKGENNGVTLPYLFWGTGNQNKLINNHCQVKAIKVKINKVIKTTWL